ncbi:helix-turn-helix domain-containing protein [Bacillus cereus]|nr:helix-turn-helix domain-containing protein [Bacillus cereus]
MDFYTVKDITELLSVSERTVRRWIADKKLESIKIGG